MVRASIKKGAREREEYWRRRFQEAAEKYQLDADISLWTRHGLQRRIDSLLRIFSQARLRQRRVVDVGCGPGTHSRLLAEQGHQVVGVDYCEAALRKAVGGSKGVDVEYVVADAQHLPFAQGSFGVAVCVGVLEYLADQEAAIAEIRRVLTNQGLLILITLSSFSVRAVAGRVHRLLLGCGHRGLKLNEDDRYTRRNSPYNLRTLLRKTGFNRCEVHGIFILPESLSFLENALESVVWAFPLFVLPLAHAFLTKTEVADQKV